MLCSRFEFALVVRAGRLRIQMIELAQLGHTLDQAQHFLAKVLLHLLAGVGSVFQGIVQQARRDGRRIQAKAGQDVGDRQAVLHVRLARGAFLAFVRLFGHLKGVQDEIMTGFAAQHGNVLLEQSVNAECRILWHDGNCSTES
jgi:hypothetical protein